MQSSNNHVPLMDLRRQNAALANEIRQAIESVIERCAFIQGEEVAAFERAFASFVGSEDAVGVASGTAALVLALKGAGIGHGDEVVTTPATFIATAEAISAVGARPVFADVDATTGNIDPGAATQAITSRTKALLPVHLYGRPADMPSLRKVADEHNLVLIEDAAQAHGARLNGESCGAMGDIACFSFYPGKNLGAFGDAGAVTGSSGEIMNRVRMLRDHGRTSKYEHELIGFGERMDTIQAAVLDVKLKHLARWTRERRRWAVRYREELGGTINFIQDSPGMESCYHLMVARIPNRDLVLRRLNEAGIGAGVHYPIPLHLQPAYRHLGYKQRDFPQAERLANETISLPLFPEMTEAELMRVVKTVKAAVR